MLSVTCLERKLPLAEELRMRRTKHAQDSRRIISVTGLAMALLLLANPVIFFVSAQQPNDQLGGNWAVKTANADGTFRTTYLNLKTQGSKITGSIHVTQFYYLITANVGRPPSFTLTGSMQDGK